jgi:hypothetical protein
VAIKTEIERKKTAIVTIKTEIERKKTAISGNQDRNREKENSNK